jgi:Uma2 family endonuclease
MAIAAPRAVLLGEYLAWSEAHPDERTELIDGVIVAMARERAVHAEVKALATVALFNAVRAGGLPCRVYTDGLGVAIGDRDCFIPDVVVQCGAPIEAGNRLADAPTVLVEVLSPLTRYADMTRKLLAYFRIESVAHYLVLDTDARTVAHHTRGPGGIEIETWETGALALDPPGLAIDVAALFP